MVVDKIGNRDYALTINDVDSHDDAEYSVHATNSVGHVTCAAQLFVHIEDGKTCRPTVHYVKPVRIYIYIYIYIYSRYLIATSPPS